MLPRSLFAFFSSLIVVSAGPIRRRQCSGSSNSTVATPTLPTTGDATELPSPSGMTLKHITVGHGIQNYSCSTEGATATSAGALAVLYDITSLYPGISSDSLSGHAWNQLSADLLHTTDVPLNLVGNAITKFAADVAKPFKPDADVTVNGLTLKPIGHHIFDSSLVPTFDLYTQGEMLQAAKLNAVKAPSTADKGLLDTGACDWLQLGKKDLGTSIGLNGVYRVVTAGGNPLSCTSDGETFSVPYAAQYWFFE